MAAPRRLLCLCMLVTWLCQSSASEGRTVVLETGNDLLPALRSNDVTRIILSADHDLQQGELEALEDAPWQIRRNLTIAGPGEGRSPLLDLHFAHAVLQLCATCVFTLANISVANERRGTGPSYDIFSGEPGSVVRAVNVTRVRVACTPAPDSADIIRRTERSSQLPGRDEQQAFTFADVTFRGSSYPHSLHSIDVTKDVPPLYEEGRGRSGGYALADIQTTRVCKHSVEHTCIRRKGPDACINAKIDEVLAAEAAARAAKTGQGRASTLAPAALAAAIAVPLAAAGVLLLAGLVWWQRRGRRASGAPLLTKASDEECGSGGTRRAYSRHSQERNSSSSRPEEGSFAADPKLPRQPMGEGPGWCLTNSMMSPYISPGSDTRVSFGDLIGSGSFGRVYAARWAGMAVAVKVIEHSRDTSDAVQQEAGLMLSLNHPNIIRAFHCVTFTRSRNSAPGVTITGALQGSSTTTSGSLLPCTGPSTVPSSEGGCGSSFVTPTPAGQPLPHSSQQDQQQPPAAHSEVNPAAVRLHNLSSAEALSTAEAAAAAAAASPVSPVGLSAADWGSSPCCTDGFIGSDSCHSATEDEPTHCETWLIQEYADVGTLQAVSSKWPPAMFGGEAELYRLLLLRDAAAGLCNLHSRNIVHGDLNARNVLVSSSARSRCGLMGKLADLGLSRIIRRNKTHRTTNSCGTMSHMPPELLQSGRMSPSGDVYAFSIMMWEMASGCLAFRKLQYGQFFATVVLRDQRPPLLPGLAWDYETLMQHCWATDPADRPTSQQVLQCLDYMITLRLGAAAAAAGQGAATQEEASPATPPALLLKPPAPHPQLPQQSQQPSSASSCAPAVPGAPANNSASSSASRGSSAADAGAGHRSVASPAAPADAAPGAGVRAQKTADHKLSRDTFCKPGLEGRPGGGGCSGPPAFAACASAREV